MLSLITLLVAVSVANSFTISSSRSSSVSLKMADKSKALPFLPQPKNIVGLAGDVGQILFFIIILTYYALNIFKIIITTKGFDPVGFSNWIDVRWLREAELKHCRIAMLAVLGFIGSGIVQLPGDVHQVIITIVINKRNNYSLLYLSQ